MTSAINKDNRVSEQALVGQTPPILPAGHPDLYFLNPKNVIVVENGATVYDKYLSVGTPGSGASDGNTPPPKTVVTPPPGQASDDDPFELTSLIGEPTPVPTYDPVTCALTYWMVIKIKNTSKNPDAVKGVDARIYVLGS